MIKFCSPIPMPDKELPRCNYTKFEQNDHVERSGIVPLREQIRLFKESGVLLRATRALQYDCGDVEDFYDIDTAPKDIADYADMDLLVKRAEASARANELLMRNHAKTHDDSAGETGETVITPASADEALKD